MAQLTRTGVARSLSVLLVVSIFLGWLSGTPVAASGEVVGSRHPDDRQDNTIPCRGYRNPVYDAAGHNAGDVGLIIHGRCVKLEESVYVINGSTLLPMRETLQLMQPGYYNNVVFAKWFQNHNTACADETSIVICYPVGRNYVYWNGVIMPLGQGAVVINGRTRVPFRDLIEKSGGKVNWDGTTRTITVDVSGPNAFVIWADPKLVCTIMGFQFDGNCDSDRVIAGYYAYKTWGTDYVIERMLDGTLQQPGMTRYLNKIGWDKGGVPLEGPQLKWTEAALNTGIDILTAIWIGSEIRYPKSLSGTVSPVGRELVFDASAAAGKHDIFFWAPRQSVSEHALHYQVRGNTSLLRVTATGQRQALEYAWRGVAFDAKEDVASTGVRIFIERKSDAGFVARLSKSKPEFREGLMDDFADEIFRQFRVLRGEKKVIFSWEVETVDLQILVQEAFDSKVLPKLIKEYGAESGAWAFEELKEIFRLIVMP